MFTKKHPFFFLKSERVVILCNEDLAKVLEKVNKGDDLAFEELLQVFGSLIAHYKRKLKYDDAEQDLILYLIELIKNLELKKFVGNPDYLQRYIAASLGNQYIYLSKRKSKIMIESYELYENYNYFQIEEDENIDLKAALKKLSKKQQTAIVLRYKFGFTDAEIGDKLKISRQAVNKLESRAFIILRKYLK